MSEPLQELSAPSGRYVVIDGGIYQGFVVVAMPSGEQRYEWRPIDTFPTMVEANAWAERHQSEFLSRG